MSNAKEEVSQKKRVAVIGSRDFKDKKRLFEILDKNFNKIEMIVSGGAHGADELGRAYAQERGLPCLIYYPRWHSLDGEFDRGAGFRRNHLIIRNCDIVLAFWDGASKGTANSLEIAKILGKKFQVFPFTPEVKEKVQPPSEIVS